MHQRRVRACVRAKWLEVVVSAYQAPLPTGILQTIMLEWVALPPPGDLPDPVDSLPLAPPGKPLSGAHRTSNQPSVWAEETRP